MFETSMSSGATRQSYSRANLEMVSATLSRTNRWPKGSLVGVGVTVGAAVGVGDGLGSGVRVETGVLVCVDSAVSRWSCSVLLEHPARPMERISVARVGASSVRGHGMV